jgi:hypothetical protein
MTKRDGRALWRALREQEMKDDMHDLSSMSDAELDAYIDANGGDAKAIGEGGEAFVKELFARREKNAWHGDMAEKLERVEGHRAATAKERLPREELLRRLDAARNDPRFSAPVAALFHDKKTEESTDEELHAMLDQIALLAKLEDEKKNGKM